MSDSGMDEKSIANLFKKFERAYPKWIEMIAQSFLPEEQQELYRGQIERMSAKLGIVNCGRCVILSTPHDTCGANKISGHPGLTHCSH